MARAHQKVEQGRETLDRLVEIGRTLFSRDGFNGVSAERLVKQAGLTRGALYHHFGGKPGLFEAVFVACEKEIAQRIIAASQTRHDPVEQLTAGSLAFLEACADPVLRRIVVDEAPAVLGWTRWREIDAAHGMALLRGAIQRIDDDGRLPGYSVEALTYLLSGGMNELAMWVADSSNPDSDLQTAKETLAELIHRIFESAP